MAAARMRNAYAKSEPFGLSNSFRHDLQHRGCDHPRVRRRGLRRELPPDRLRALLGQLAELGQALRADLDKRLRPLEHEFVRRDDVDVRPQRLNAETALLQ